MTTGRVYFNEFDPVAAAWLRQLIKDGLLPEGEVDERSIKEVSPADLRGFTHCHFFAGIGGWPLALEQAGWPADRPVWTGSCPCQPYSSAGKQLGDADPRNLWPDFYRLISECRPVTVIGEQVEGAIRKGWLDRVCGDMEGAGYAVGSVVLGAHSAGAPHIRQRLFWVADAGQFAPRLALPGSGIRAVAEPHERRAEAVGEPGRRGDAVELADAGRSGRGAGLGIIGGQDGTGVRGAEPDADSELRSVANDEEFGRGQGHSHHRGRGAGIRQEGNGSGPADSGDDGELGDTASDGRQEHERGPGPREESDTTDAGRGPGGVGDADRTGPLAGRAAAAGGGHGCAALANGSVGVTLGDANGTGPQGEPAPRPGEGRAVGRAGSVGNWDDFAIVPCLDNKARRVEPGSFPLAHGVPRKLGPLFAVLVGMGIDPKRAKRLVRNAGSRLAQAGRNRVGRLRGYGNAIVPPTAAAFVRAFLETEAEGGVR